VRTRIGVDNGAHVDIRRVVETDTPPVKSPIAGTTTWFLFALVPLRGRPYVGAQGLDVGVRPLIPANFSIDAIPLGRSNPLNRVLLTASVR
jgi:hypothetical protein